MFTSSTPLSGGSLTGRFVQHKLNSKHMGGERTVTVRLPDHYDPDKNYPVVYLQDGQNMFDARSGFMGREWQVDETFARLNAGGRVPEAVLVGVHHGPARNSEYTHRPDPNYGGGEGQKYEDFFMSELMPAVEATYSMDPTRRVLMGSSLGGLVSLAIGLNHPASFAAVAALSPSVWWADGQMPTETLEREIGSERPRIWIDMGTEEGGTDEFGKRSLENGNFSDRPRGGNGVQDVRDRTREMGEALLSKGWKLDHDLRYHEPLGARHDESSWAVRIGDVAEWVLR
ncbi:MAG: alpha/beta hydrolase-fold protein [Vulcanimicrobiota bacterium]